MAYDSTEETLNELVVDAEDIETSASSSSSSFDVYQELFDIDTCQELLNAVA